MTTTLAIDYSLGRGLDPFVFHVSSFLFFAAQCIVLLFLYRRLMDLARPHPWNRWLALFAATWYGLHTVNAETVNYVIARSEILSTLGVALAVLMFSIGGRWRRWGLYVVPAAAAVFAKEQGAMAAPILMVYVALFDDADSAGSRASAAQSRAPAARHVAGPGGLSAILITGLRLSTTFVPGGTTRWSYSSRSRSSSRITRPCSSCP